MWFSLDVPLCACTLLTQQLANFKVCCWDDYGLRIYQITELPTTADEQGRLDAFIFEQENKKKHNCCKKKLKKIHSGL